MRNTEDTLEAARSEAYFRARLQQVTDLLAELVSIDSPSGDGAALGRAAVWLAGKLEACGASVEEIGGGVPHLRAVVPGRQPELKPLLLVGHFDTVWPLGEATRRPPSIEGGRMTGPGVYDMKAGLALGIWVLDALQAQGIRPRRPVVFFMNADEELGSPGSRPLIEREARAAEAALILEPSTAPDMIRLRRKGTGIFEVRITGRAAHAGADPSAGVSAISELARQIMVLDSLNDPATGTTVNVGTVKGGTRRNVVAAEAEALIDLRFVEPAAGDRAEKAIFSLAPQLKGARVEVQGGINRPAMAPGPETLELYDRAVKIAGELGFELREELGGGASDGNFTSATGCPTLCGLGGVGGGAHALDEHIVVEWLPRKAALLMQLLLRS